MQFLDLLRSIFQSDLGSFGTVVVLLGCAFWIVHYVTKKITQFENKTGNIDSLEKKADNKYEKIENKFNELKQDIHIIKALLETFKTNSNPFAKRQSPISLSSTGNKVAKEIQAESIIDNHWDYIFNHLKEDLNDNCNPYDVQVSSFKIGNIFLNFINKEELNTIKNNAFINGFNIDIYSLLFGVIIRNKMLKIKGYTIDQIDNFEPQSS